ncbi:BON domain-containing protein [Streptomyces sp. NPDC002187]|uniref:BON domain-containing protein n=1 Tax=Streptomyces sp. NPDC002187 TaxID=3364637 RepID=UPI0036A3C452
MTTNAQGDVQALAGRRTDRRYASGETGQVVRLHEEMSPDRDERRFSVTAHWSVTKNQLRGWQPGVRTQWPMWTGAWRAHRRIGWIEDALVNTLLLTPDVVDGVVTLEEQLERRSQIDVVLRLTQQVDGVVSVVDRLSYRLDDAEIPSEDLTYGWSWWTPRTSARWNAAAQSRLLRLSPQLRVGYRGPIRRRSIPILSCLHRPSHACGGRMVPSEWAN